MNDDDEMPDGSDLSVQPSLPSLGLPTFEGILPVGVVNRLNGAGERINRAMGFGERVVLLVEGEVTNVGHGKTAQGMKRIHTISVLDLYELEGKAGRRILTAARQSYKLADDQRHGKIDLLREHAAGAGWKLTPDGYVDASGRLLDEEELAEIRGSQFEQAANDPRFDPVALVHADGSRAMWPDDFPEAGDTAPAAGEFLGDLQVVEVLDGVTGETLATWTAEQEDARLAALEAEALAEEARQDAEAFAELQAGRGLGPNGEPWDDPFVGLPGPDGPIQPKEDAEPFPGYEEKTARDIVGELAAMDDRDAVFAVAEWEEAHGGRKTIINAATARAAELLGAQS